MVYKGYNKTYDFRKFKTIIVFGNDTKKMLLIWWVWHLTKHIKEFKSKRRPENSNLKRIK